MPPVTPVKNPRTNTQNNRIYAKPFSPNDIGWVPLSDKEQLPNRISVEESGKFYFDVEKIQLYIPKCQRDPDKFLGYVDGKTLCESLREKYVLSDTVLDWLLESPHLIPKEWKFGADKKILYIFFWGRIYQSNEYNPYIRCLCWRNDKWEWHLKGVYDDFPLNCLTAIYTMD